MDDIVTQCPGVLTIHDDMFIYGKDDKDHNANLVNLFNVAQKEGLVFNSTKCAIKQESVTFFGGIFSAKGYSSDPGEIQGINDMPVPQTKQELQSFSRCHELPADICATSESPNRTTQSPAEEGEHLCMGRKCE